MDGFPQGGDNRLLQVLAPGTRSALAPAMTHIRLKLRDIMYRQGEAIDYVYFPTDGVASIVAPVEGTAPVEVATVGNEGMVGLPLFLGAATTPGDAFAQVPGAAYRMPATDFFSATRELPEFALLLARFTQAMFVQISQSSACNRAHSVDERCARWLLMTHDRVRRDEFPLSQEFLAQMLGVRRGSVNVVAALLQQAGFIRYERGRVHVLDRAGLESAACNCYAVIRREYDDLLRPRA